MLLKRLIIRKTNAMQTTVSVQTMTVAKVIIIELVQDFIVDLKVGMV